jgi:prepilin-type processing-associated H-X9-DG protein
MRNSEKMEPVKSVLSGLSAIFGSAGVMAVIALAVWLPDSLFCSWNGALSAHLIGFVFYVCGLVFRDRFTGVMNFLAAWSIGLFWCAFVFNFPFESAKLARGAWEVFPSWLLIVYPVILLLMTAAGWFVAGRSYRRAAVWLLIISLWRCIMFLFNHMAISAGEHANTVSIYLMCFLGFTIFVLWKSGVFRRLKILGSRCVRMAKTRKLEINRMQKIAGNSSSEFLVFAALFAAVWLFAFWCVRIPDNIDVMTFLLSFALGGAAVSVSLKEKNKNVNYMAGFFLIALLILLITLTGIAPSHRDPRRRAVKINCQSNLKQIGLGLRQYAQENNGFFPPYAGEQGLKILFKKEYLRNLDVCVCPAVKNHRDQNSFISDYEYMGGLKESDPSDTVICYDKNSNHRNFGNALYIDGHVLGYSGKDWLERARKP